MIRRLVKQGGRPVVRRIAARTFAFIGALMLAACATQHVAPTAFGTLPDSYSVSGRAAVTSTGRGHGQFSFGWTHVGASDQVDINNPFGQTLARIVLDAQGARYYDADGKLKDEDDVEALSEREIGWRLPAAGLRYWLLGLAEPDHPSQWHDASGGRTLDQDGWHIVYPPSGTAAPSRLIMTRPDLKVTIALYDWQQGAAPQ